MKAVFFDANGVLYYRQDKDIHLAKFLAEQGLEVLSNDCLELNVGDIHNRALHGEVSQEVYAQSVLSACGVTDPNLIRKGLEAIESDHSNIKLFPELKETLIELKLRGFKLGVITDAAVPRQRKMDWLKAQGLDISWDAYANSMDLGVRKPHALMYQTAMQQAGVKPDESVFVGHDARELFGARSAGMHTVAFNYDENVEADDYIDGFDKLLQLPYLQHTS